MKVFNQLDRIDKFNRLMIQRRTGAPVEFAYRLGVSRTSLYELIDELRSHGAPIVYSKSEKTYYFSRPYEISISCIMRPLTVEEVKEYNGGGIFPKILFSRTLQNDLSMVTLPC